MKKQFKILLATDYSAAVMNAERYAVQFAKKTNSVLVFLHAYELPPNAKSADFPNTEEKKLQAHRDKLFSSLGMKSNDIENECVVREGAASGAIRMEAKETEADFIVIGTHGMTGFNKLFFGSHAWSVIKKSSIPVFAIPQDALFSEFKSILFATEYREGEISAINFLSQFSEQFNSELTILHVTNYILSKKFEAEMYVKFKKEVIERVPYPKLNILLNRNDNLMAGLQKACDEKSADLLVMSPERPFLLEKIFLPIGSTTKKMTFHTHVPLLAIPDYYNPEYSSFWRSFELMDERFLDEE